MSANNGKIPRAEALEVVRTSIEGHTFSPATAEQDVNFAKNLLQWLIYRFAVYPTDLRILSDSNDLYSSAYLLDSIRPIFLSKEVAGDKYARRVSSTLRHMPDLEVVPSRLPMLGALREQDMSFQQIIEHFTANPGDLEGASLARCYLNAKYAVSFWPGTSALEEWGIRLVCDARYIRVAPFGKDGETEPAANWMLTYYQRLHILAEVAVHVGLLTVKHATHVNEFIGEDQIDEIRGFEENFQPDTPYFGYVQDNSVCGRVLNALIERGAVDADVLKN